MSGTTIVSPNIIDTTLIQDGQAVGAITPGDIREMEDSLAGLSISQQAGTSYTFVATDRGTMVESTSSSATIFTIPTNATTAIVVGTVIAFRQYGTGQLTIAAASGVTLRVTSSATTRAQYCSGAIHKRGTDEWVLSGEMT